MDKYHFQQEDYMRKKKILENIRILRDKTNIEKLIVFVGAGVSCNVEGMPSWSDLITKIAKAINHSKCATCRKRESDCKNDLDFCAPFSADEYLKIPQYLYNENKELYNKILHDNIEHSLDIDAPLSNAILDLIPAHIITTNYDKLIEICQSTQVDNYDVVVMDKDLLCSNKKRHIIKMHGDMSIPETIVLKEADYLQYSQNHVLIEMFVKSLLADHTILFLGYSMNDYNIKLIISWINYIRTQNKSITSNTRFAYIVLDEERIDKNQKKYFEANNIGVINIRKMPIINGIAEDIGNDRGKRLYSFLKTISDVSLERIFGQEFLYSEAVGLMSKHRFVDAKSICKMLYLTNYSLDAHELVIFSEEQYDSLVGFLSSENESSTLLKRMLVSTGIYVLRLVSSGENRKQETLDLSDCSIIISDNELYRCYQNNQYNVLNKKLNDTDNDFCLESCFYRSLILSYDEQIFEWFSRINYSELTSPQKIRYLFNSEVLQVRKKYKRFDSVKIEKYIKGLADKKQSDIFRPYLDIFEGNYRLLLDLEKSVKKLREQYYSGSHSFVGCSSLQELFRIRKIAIEQYMFYFNNTLFFEGFSDLKKILKIYIEAILCTNGNFTDTFSDFWGERSKKDRYQIDMVDFDILTKMISIKDLNNLFEDYKVELLACDEEFCDFATGCFENIASSILDLNLYSRFYEAPHTLINCALLLMHIPLNESQKNRVKDVFELLFRNGDFVDFYFSIDQPEHSLSIKIFDRLLKNLPKREKIDIVQKIVNSSNFEKHYVNLNTRSVQRILSAFIISESEGAQEQLTSIIHSFDGLRKLHAIRLLYRHVKNDNLEKECKQFIVDNFEKLDGDDIFDFAFDNWLIITPEHEAKLINDAISLYNHRKTTGVRTYPDHFKMQLELLYILYITEKISSLEPLKEMIGESDFLKFFLDEENFDYTKIDFSNYMWENIANTPRFMKRIIKHRLEIIPILAEKVKQDQATEFEKKILYGQLLKTE